MDGHFAEREPSKRTGDRRASGSGATREQSGLPDSDIASMLALQHDIGNRAVLRLVLNGGPSASAVSSRPGPTSTSVQRAPLGGIATPGRIGGFARAAMDFWKDPSNANRQLSTLSDHLLHSANMLVPYPCKPVYMPSATYDGAFDSQTWSIEMNTSKFSDRAGVTKVGQLTQSEVASIADTIYHEARHSEQCYAIAQVRAGRGESAKRIAKAMSIPTAVAAHAAGNPLRGGYLMQGAKEWEPTFVGKYSDYEGNASELVDEIDAVQEQVKSATGASVLTVLVPDIAKIRERMPFFSRQQSRILRGTHRNSLDLSVLGHVRKILMTSGALVEEHELQHKYPEDFSLSELTRLAGSAYRAAYAAYRDVPEERDAWATGSAVGQAVKRLDAGTK